MLIILGLLCGLVLAFRFNVLILLPTILFGWMLVLVGAAVTARVGFSIALEMALVAIAVQVGYLGGFIFKWRLLVNRRRNSSAKPVTAPDGAILKSR